VQYSGDRRMTASYTVKVKPEVGTNWNMEKVLQGMKNLYT
jgi:hypothetical protein